MNFLIKDSDMKRFHLILIMLLLSISSVFAQYDWPMVNGGPQRRSWAEHETALAPPFQYTYSFLDCPGVCNISCKDNMAYFGMSTTPNTVKSYKLVSMDSVWSFQVPGSTSAIDFTPAVGGSLVLAGGQNGLGLFALNALTGMPTWSRPIGSLYNRHPVIDGNRVFVQRDSTYCLDLATGNTIWAVPVSTQSTPTIDGSHVYICGPATTSALDKLTGQEVWSITGTGNNALAVDENYLYCDRSGNLSACNKNDGTIVWNYPIPGGIGLPNLDGDAIAVSDKYVCAVLWSNQNQKAELFTLNKQTGAFVWRKEFDSEGIFTPTIANSIVYFVKYLENTLYGYDIATGAEVFKDNSRSFLYQSAVANHSLLVTAGNEVRMYRNSPTGIYRPATVPQDDFAITNAYPNPFRGTSTLAYRLSRGVLVRFSLLNAVGQTVKVFHDGFESAGEHHFIFDRSNLPGGVYRAVLEIDGKIKSRSIVLY